MPVALDEQSLEYMKRWTQYSRSNMDNVLSDVNSMRADHPDQTAQLERRKAINVKVLKILNLLDEIEENLEGLTP